MVVIVVVVVIEMRVIGTVVTEEKGYILFNSQRKRLLLPWILEYLR